jgi:hypothetical protein
MMKAAEAVHYAACKGGRMQRELSKQQEAVLTRAQREGGTSLSTTAYAALVELGGILRESEDASILTSVSSTLQSLVDLGLMVRNRPGKYQLTEEGSRVAQSLGEKYPFA